VIERRNGTNLSLFVFCSVGGLLEYSAWFGEALVVFRATFDGSGFDPIRPVRDLVFDDIEEHQLVEFRAIGRVERGTGQGGRPLADGIDSPFEAQVFAGYVVGMRAFNHEGADKVVRDDEHPEFLFDHFRGFAAKDIHAHGRFYVAQEQFDLPASAVEFGEGLLGKGDRIGQGGDENEVLGSEAFDVNVNAQFEAMWE